MKIDQTWQVNLELNIIYIVSYSLPDNLHIYIDDMLMKYALPEEVT